MRRPLGAIARLLLPGLALTLVLGVAGAHAATCIGSAGKRCAYDRIATYGERSPGELRQPTGLALGPDGRIYVVDAQASNEVAYLDVYDRDARFLERLAPPGGGRFAPTEVGVSADGTVYALDGKAATVHRFDTDRSHRALRLPGRDADRLAVQGDGSFWLLHTAGAMVTHHDRSGNLVGGFRVQTGADLIGLTGLGVSADGHVFVGRWTNGSDGFAEYTPQGTEVRTIRSLPGGHVAFAGDGDLVAASGALISRAARSGTEPTTEIGWPGSDGAQLSQVEGIAVAPPGLLAAGRPGEEAYVVADRDNHRVQILATDGSRLAIVGAPQASTVLEPEAAWGLPDGAMIVADAGHRRLARFAASGAFEGRADGGSAGSYDGGALNPVNGESVVQDGSFRVRRFGADGASLGTWMMPGYVDGGDIVGWASGVAVAGDGTIWTMHSPEPRGGLLAAYRPDGTPVRVVADPHLDRPASIATGPGGEVFVLEGWSNSSSFIDVFGPEGSFRRRLEALNCTRAESIAVDAAGRIYAGLGGNVAILDPSGALLARFGALGSAVGQFSGTVLSVQGDVLTIAERNNNRVTRVRIDPAALTSPGPEPCGGAIAMELGTTIPVRGAYAQILLNCAGAIGATCDGAVSLLRSSVKAGTPLKRKDVLATSAYRVAGPGLVALKLRAAERKALSRKRRLTARVVVRPKRGAAITRRVTLRLAPKAKAKAKSKAKARAKARS